MQSIVASPPDPTVSQSLLGFEVFVLDIIRDGDEVVLGDLQPERIMDIDGNH